MTPPSRFLAIRHLCLCGVLHISTDFSWDIHFLYCQSLFCFTILAWLIIMYCLSWLSHCIWCFVKDCSFINATWSYLQLWAISRVACRCSFRLLTTLWLHLVEKNRASPIIQVTWEMFGLRKLFYFSLNYDRLLTCDELFGRSSTYRWHLSQYHLYGLSHYWNTKINVSRRQQNSLSFLSAHIFLLMILVLFSMTGVVASLSA